jgi:hypothetical protein
MRSPERNAERRESGAAGAATEHARPPLRPRCPPTPADRPPAAAAATAPAPPQPAPDATQAIVNDPLVKRVGRTLRSKDRPCRALEKTIRRSLFALRS